MESDRSTLVFLTSWLLFINFDVRFTQNVVAEEGGRSFIPLKQSFEATFQGRPPTFRSIELAMSNVVFRKSCRRSAFTLVELVIVVLVLGIITAVAAPKMFNTANEARESASRQSLTVLRSSIELYRAREGSYPTTANITTQLLPYLQGSFPAPAAAANPNATVVASTQNPIATVETGTAGWAYNATTGEIRINDATYIAW